MPPLFVLPALLACTGSTTDAPPTWHDDVAPIVADRCASCHQSGQIGPFPLDDQDVAESLAEEIVDAALSRRMPPYGVDAGGTCGTFQDPAWLGDAELDTLADWLAADAPVGAEQPFPDVPAQPTLARVDLTLDLGVEHTPTDTPDEYRCFRVDPGLAEDAFLTAYEVVPDNAELVHHVILYTLDSDAAEEQALALDEADDDAGYECFGSSLVGESRPVAAWAPGAGATRFPRESGLRLLAGRGLILQVHYYTGEGTGPDRTAVNLELEQSVEREALVFLAGDLTMSLDPGLEAAEADFELSLAAMGLPLGVYLQGVFPHLHTRGRTVKRTATRPDEDTRCLAEVPAWDFNWQQLYFYTEPEYLWPDDTLRLTCTFDTTGDDEPVRWGDGTDDEMCLIGLVATLG